MTPDRHKNGDGQAPGCYDCAIMTASHQPRARMPRGVLFGLWTASGFLATAATLLWLERGPSILLDLASLSAAFICF